MSILNTKKENNLSLRFLQVAIVLIIVFVMDEVFSNFKQEINTLNIIGFGVFIVSTYLLFTLQLSINKNARDMREL